MNLPRREESLGWNRLDWKRPVLFFLTFRADSLQCREFRPRKGYAYLVDLCGFPDRVPEENREQDRGPNV